MMISYDSFRVARTGVAIHKNDWIEYELTGTLHKSTDKLCVAGQAGHCQENVVNAIAMTKLAAKIGRGTLDSVPLGPKIGGGTCLGAFGGIAAYEYSVGDGSSQTIYKSRFKTFYDFLSMVFGFYFNHIFQVISIYHHPH